MFNTNNMMKSKQKSIAEIEADNNKKSAEIDEKENEKDKDKAVEGLLHVIDTAKLKCDLCTTPEGDLKVNFDTPTIQDKKTATIKEKDMTSLIFKGNCKKSPNSSSPCASVMQLGDWKDTGTSLIQDQPPLLLKSTIKCNYGGVDIVITDCRQKCEPEEIDVAGVPVPREEKVDVDFIVYPRIWLDDLENCNYGFDWNRDHDEVLPLRTKKKEELINNCVKGKNLFQEYYDSAKITILHF